MLVEVNLISAQDLPTRSRKHYSCMKTYVVAYVKKERLVSRIDRVGNQNPTWNDKFLFPVDDLADSCLVFEIFRVRTKKEKMMGLRRDKRIGVVNVLLERLLKETTTSTTKDRKHDNDDDDDDDDDQVVSNGVCLGLYVHNPKSKEPQGILNIGSHRIDQDHLLLPSPNNSTGFDYRTLMMGGCGVDEEFRLMAGLY